MELDRFDLVATLQALPETDPIEVEGIDLGRRHHNTCQAWCIRVTNNVCQTICIGGTC